MLKTIRYSALLAGASALLAPAAIAQERNLDRETSDIRTFSGRVENAPSVFTVTIPADTSMRIDVLATGDFDPVVRVLDARSGDLIAEDDDGGDGLNSRVNVSGENGRRVRIEVDSFDSEWVEEGESYGGRFNLQLTSRTGAAVGTRAVTYGARETGTILDSGDENLFTFRAAAGDMIEVALLSEGELDPYLTLRDASGGDILTDDDGGQGFNSYLRHTFEDAGTYTIVASGFGSSTGDYTLRVRDRREASAQLPLQVIGFNDTASGEVTSSWNSDSMMPTHIDYQLSEEALAAVLAGNGQVTIRMNAGEGGDADFGGSIDPLLELGFETPYGFAVADRDDDGGEGLNSMLPVDLGLIADNPGLLDMLRIRAQGLGGSSGAYTLTITPGMEERIEPADAEIMLEAAAPPPIRIPPPGPPAPPRPSN
ncbi:PPC domain-containing protein [Aurantiacibacter gangjinensis]|uniref:Uncharacterized protein n=1 Tax=Aurantiacibacter gangjinensis TaxID=502682 RepID=A0A0G9MP93_9SPHN|nr:PPC domain-containing protein [Aurantiacibacter gangjinensis]APE28306.1 alkaline phosphatase [Aurantiacibacter gangjinensis]KLE32547.1 hypothetical protein AAW01_00275 [Aurantiacibacter gangjinensis]